MILYKAEGSKTIRELGKFRATAEDTLLYSLVIIVKLNLFVRKKNTKNWGKLPE
jgi:hypothetical protein